MSNDTVANLDIKPGQSACHRKQPIALPGPLGKLTIAHQPCIQEKCTLWDVDNGRCRDVSNSIYLEILSHTLHTIVDHLPPQLP